MAGLIKSGDAVWEYRARAATCGINQPGPACCGFRSWTTLRSCSGADGGFPFEGAEGFELAGFMLPAAGDEFLFTVPADGYEPTLVFRLVDPATKTWLRSGDRVPFRLGSSWIINPAIKY